MDSTAPADSSTPGRPAPVTFARIADSPASWPANAVHGWAPADGVRRELAERGIGVGVRGPGTGTAEASSA
ncbi:hypothetical protein OG530_31375 [Streptomyces decoyicus]